MSPDTAVRDLFDGAIDVWWSRFTLATAAVVATFNEHAGARWFRAYETEDVLHVVGGRAASVLVEVDRADQTLTVTSRMVASGSVVTHPFTIKAGELVVAIGPRRYRAPAAARLLTPMLRQAVPTLSTGEPTDESQTEGEPRRPRRRQRLRR